MLYGVGQTQIQAGEYVDVALWADEFGAYIPASLVAYSFPEPGAMILLGMGLSALVLLRGRSPRGMVQRGVPDLGIRSPTRL